MKPSLFASIAASAVIVSLPAFAQDPQRDACAELTRYVQDRQGQDLGVAIEDLRRLEQSGDQARCQAQIEWFEARAETAPQDPNRQQAETDSEGRIVIQQPAPAVRIDQAEPQITVTQTPPTVNVAQPQPEIIVQQPAPEVTINIPQPRITVRMPDPNVQVSQNQPEVQVRQPEPEVQVVQPEQQAQVLLNQDQQQAEVRLEGSDQPNVQLQRTGEPSVRYEAEEPQVRIQRAEGQPQVTFEAADAGASARQQAGQGEERTDQALQATGIETGSTTAEQPATAGMQRIAVSDITGRPLVNARGNELGEVERVVMSPQQPGEAFAVVAYGGFLGVGEKRVTIPLRDLTLRGDELVVEGMTDDQLRELPDFREGAGMQPMDEGEAAQIRVQG